MKCHTSETICMSYEALVERGKRSSVNIDLHQEQQPTGTSFFA